MTDPYYATPFFPAAPPTDGNGLINALLRRAAGRGSFHFADYAANGDDAVGTYASTAAASATDSETAASETNDGAADSETAASETNDGAADAERRVTPATLALLDTRPSASADQLSATTSAALAQALGVSALEKATGYVTAGLNGVVSQLIELLGLAQTALTEAGFAVTGEVTDADLADAVAAVHAAAESRGTPSGNQAYTNRVSLTLALALHAGDLRAARRVGPAIGSA